MTNALTRPFLQALARRQGAGEWALGLTDVDLYVPAGTIAS